MPLSLLTICCPCQQVMGCADIAPSPSHNLLPLSTGDCACWSCPSHNLLPLSTGDCACWSCPSHNLLPLSTGDGVCWSCSFPLLTICCPCQQVMGVHELPLPLLTICCPCQQVMGCADIAHSPSHNLSPLSTGDGMCWSCPFPFSHNLLPLTTGNGVCWSCPFLFSQSVAPVNR